MKKKRKSRSLRWQAVTSTISTTFVLILLGLTILCGLTARHMSESVRQSLTVTVLFADEATDSTAKAFQKALRKQAWTKTVTYISKEQALKEQSEAMGTDPTEFLGMNPFNPSLELNLQAQYACTDSLLWISKVLRENPQVSDVVYQKDIVERLNSNLHKISYVLLGVAVVLMLITLVLINNTVRLSVYSRRFVIHTMKLVGASWGFIRRPFMARAFWIGLSSGILADAALLAGLRLLWEYDRTMTEYVPLENILITGASVMVCGLLLTLICTFVSVGHFLGMRESELYG
ncbi:MAG: permease-like cell division protein FtsX [Prevotellaceae bacterium]|nr:permease-like cell division protein FtsX [Prevotellaceae bacterium]MCD8304355.1 permease-like cell division protein FtsX [Prevotellaceae bacterium]